MSRGRVATKDGRDLSTSDEALTKQVILPGGEDLGSLVEVVATWDGSGKSLGALKE